MLNAVGREIPEEILKETGKQPYQGAFHFDSVEYKKDAPKTRPVIDPKKSKLLSNIHEALVK